MNVEQYNEINELLSRFSKLSAALELAEAEIKTVQLAAAEELLPKHAAAKIALGEVEAALKKLSLAHYEELFPEDKKRTHATPFGSLQYRKSSSLEVDDEEKSILKIEAACTRFPEDGALGSIFNKSIRTRKDLNLEVLEQLDDTTLASFGIRRVEKENFKVIPFDMKADQPAKAAKKMKAKSA